MAQTAASPARPAIPRKQRRHRTLASPRPAQTRPRVDVNGGPRRDQGQQVLSRPYRRVGEAYQALRRTEQSRLELYHPQRSQGCNLPHIVRALSFLMILTTYHPFPGYNLRPVKG